MCGRVFDTESKPNGGSWRLVELPPRERECVCVLPTTLRESVCACVCVLPTTLRERLVELPTVELVLYG
jgi:hypothetical protein